MNPVFFQFIKVSTKESTEATSIKAHSALLQKNSVFSFGGYLLVQKEKNISSISFYLILTTFQESLGSFQTFFTQD